MKIAGREGASRRLGTRYGPEFETRGAERSIAPLDETGETSSRLIAGITEHAASPADATGILADY